MAIPNPFPSDKLPQISSISTEEQGSSWIKSWIPSQLRWGRATHRAGRTTFQVDDLEYEDPERIPFLQPSSRSLSSDSDDFPRRGPHPSAFAVTVTVSLVMLILDIASSVPTAPRMVMFEDIICRDHYDAWGDNSKLGDCKVNAVQAELALINGWKDTFEKIPALLVAVPYGILADRIGRHKVMILALTGCLLCDAWVAVVCFFPQFFPLRAVWGSGIWQLVGGGGTTVIAICYTMIADVCAPEKRSAAFSQLYAAVLISEMVSVPIGSSLISLDPWIPVLGSLGFLALAIFSAALFVPIFVTPAHNTRLQKDHSPFQGRQYVPSRGLKSRFSQTVVKLSESCQVITLNIFLIIGALFICQLSRRVSGILLQYSSFKFDWGYAKASYLISLRSGVNLIALATLVPALKRVFTKTWGCRQTQSDKYITIFSGVCLALGSFFTFLAASPGLVILGQILCAVGFAFLVTAHSLLTSMVDSNHLALTNTAVSAANSLGQITGGPLLASIFQWGLSRGEFWAGMPFLFTAVLLSIATLAVSITTAP